MIGYTPRALTQVQALRKHYEKLERIDAVRAVDRSLREAERKIEIDVGVGIAAPRPYPQLSRTGRAWVLAGRYWVAYSTAPPPVIVAVFYDMADIPGRF